LEKARSVTLRQYYASFKSLSGALAGVFTASPLLSMLLPSGSGGYAFPPLGVADGPARFGTVLLALATTYVVFFSVGHWRDKDFWLIASGVGLAILSLCLYLTLYMRFVRTISIPSEGTSISVSVGYQRTDFAKATFDSETDWELLRQRGVAEEEIWKLWTTRSIILARLGLYASHCGFILLLVAGCSRGVVHGLQSG
jgi:hypothetical protein